MAWQPIDDGKPPLAYDEKEIIDKDSKPKIPKDTIKKLQNELANDIKTGVSKPKTPRPRQTPNEVIFDSKKGYRK